MLTLRTGSRLPFVARVIVVFGGSTEATEHLFALIRRLLHLTRTCKVLARLSTTWKTCTFVKMLLHIEGTHVLQHMHMFTTMACSTEPRTVLPCTPAAVAALIVDGGR